MALFAHLEESGLTAQDGDERSAKRNPRADRWLAPFSMLPAYLTSSPVATTVWIPRKTLVTIAEVSAD